MRQDESERAGSTYRDLFTLSSSTLSREAFEKDIGERIRKAESLTPDARRRMLDEDSLAADVGRLDGEIRETAIRVLRGEIRATAEVKREVRRASARLGQLNAVLVGRFPHLTPLLEKVSESYLDAMFVLGNGNGIMSVRLRKAQAEEGFLRQDGTAPGRPQPLSPPHPTSGAMTVQATKREVRCTKCGWWWHHPREPIHFGSWDEWAEEHPERETLTCPNCGEVTEVSEGTVRFSKKEKAGRSERVNG